MTTRQDIRRSGPRGSRQDRRRGGGQGSRQGNHPQDTGPALRDPAGVMSSRAAVTASRPPFAPMRAQGLMFIADARDERCRTAAATQG